LKKTVNNGKTPPKPWCGIGDEFGDFLDGDTVLFTEFMWEDVGYTWKNYFGKARIAMEKKSFGWWFSYPTLKGTVNTALCVWSSRRYCSSNLRHCPKGSRKNNFIPLSGTPKAGDYYHER